MSSRVHEFDENWVKIRLAEREEFISLFDNKHNFMFHVFATKYL